MYHKVTFVYGNLKKKSKCGVKYRMQAVTNESVLKMNHNYTEWDGKKRADLSKFVKMMFE